MEKGFHMFELLLSPWNWIFKQLWILLKACSTLELLFLTHLVNLQLFLEMWRYLPKFWNGKKIMGELGILGIMYGFQNILNLYPCRFLYLETSNTLIGTIFPLPANLWAFTCKHCFIAGGRNSLKFSGWKTLWLPLKIFQGNSGSFSCQIWQGEAG